MAASFAKCFHFIFLSSTSKVDTVQDVVFDTAGEENRFLLDESKLLLMVPPVIQVLQILAAEEHLAVSRVVEPLNQGDDRGLSTARVAYKCDDLVLMDIYFNTLKNWYIFLRWIGKFDIVHFDLRIALRSIFFIRFLSAFVF